MKRLGLAALVAILLIVPGGSAHPAAAAAPSLDLVHSGILTIGTNMPYPPMESYNPRHLPVGADIALGAALAARLGLKVAWVQIDDFSTIIPTLLRHRYDIIMSSMGITSDRQALVNFIPYMRAGASIVVARGNLKHVQSLDDLSGLNASAQESTTEVDVIVAENKRLAKLHRPLIALKTYLADTTALLQLERGQSDAYLTDFPVAAYHVALSGGALAIAGQQIDVVPYGIAVRKGDHALFSSLTAALHAMRHDGAYQHILAEYHVNQGALS